MNCRVFLFLVVAIDGFLFVTDAEERGLKDKYMLLFHQVGEELEKERDQQEPDMHAVHIGIRGNDDPVIAQSVQPVFNVQGGLQQVEFFILIHDFFSQTEAVQRFSTQTEYGL